MQHNKIFFFFFVLATHVFAQDVETIAKTDFAIRDFIVSNDSLFYIKKRHVFLDDKNTNSSTDYFIGGYGLKLYAELNSNVIVTASNELVSNKSSVRFYNKKLNKVEDVYYNNEGKILDFLIIPEAKLFVLSLISKKIIFINYSEKPKFLKVIEIKLDTFSRKLIYKDGILYYATDFGMFYKYNINLNKKTQIYDGKELITDFIIEDQKVTYATTTGKLKEVDLISKREKELKLQNNFINQLVSFRGLLICGSWNGQIYVVNKTQLKIKKELKIHKRTVLKIENSKDSIFYSSSLDKTIKKWDLNKILK